MFDAKCTFGGNLKTYSIVEFQKLPDDDIERLRQFLECRKCGGKAFYRKKSVDGKAACFGSRYHTCDDANPTAQRQNEIRNAIEVEQVIASSKKITINFSSHIPVVNGNEINAVRPVAGSGSAQCTKVHTYQMNKTRTSSVGLEKILHSLMVGSDLADSDITITIDSYPFKAKNLFVNFADASPVSSVKTAKPKMYWGTLSHADDKLTWLNPADCNEVGISLGSFQASIINHFNITDKRCLEGAGIILFGRCFWNAKKTRKIIKLWNYERLFISILED
ncbi:hypothetical protein ACR71G_17590 [Xenorhabdus bovienii]|uniref:hypothetical protein n=1 Tax=Xenorhabdus bovienii TaxID=40576 RepID=UPI003DA5C4C8